VDAELIEHLERAREGDVGAFCYVVTAFRGPALSMARSILGDGHQAEDAAQEAFLIALRKLPDLEESRAFPGWLRALVRTAAIRQVRRRRPDLMEEAALEAVAAETAAPERGLVDAELRESVRGAIRELSPKAQQVIERFYLRGLSIEETAGELGIPSGTVKRRLHEARQRLRARLVGLETKKPTTEAPRRLRHPL